MLSYLVIIFEGLIKALLDILPKILAEPWLSVPLFIVFVYLGYGFYKWLRGKSGDKKPHHIKSGVLYVLTWVAIFIVAINLISVLGENYSIINFMPWRWF